MTVTDDDQRSPEQHKLSAPATDARALEIATSRIAADTEVRYVRLAGRCGDPIPDDAERHLDIPPGGGPVIFDLNGLTITGPDIVGLVSRLAAIAEAHPRCAVLSRGTGRALCRRYRFTDTTSLFATAADALQARVHRTAGFGPGWSVSAPDVLPRPDVES